MPSPSLVQHVSGSATDSNITVGGTYNLPLPNHVLSGNLLVVDVSFDNTAGGVVSVADDLNGAFTAGPAAVDATHTTTTQIFYFPNSAAGANVIHVKISTNTSVLVQAKCTEYANVATSSPSDGSNHNVASGTSISAGSITTTADGDLIHQVGTTNSTTGYTKGSSPWALLSADILDSFVSQYQVQATHGAITPALTAATSVNYQTAAIAFKSAAAGTLPGTGIRVLRMQHNNTKNETAGSVAIQFPTDTGNLLVVSMSAGKGYEISSASDNHSNTITSIGLQTSVDPNVQLYYAKNLTVAQDMKITFTMTGSSTGHGATFMLYEITGADTTNPLDTSFGTSGFASASGNQATGGAGGNVTMITTPTPSGQNELIIAVGGEAWDTATGVASPSGATFLAATYSGEPNPTNCDENNFAALYYNGSDATAETWTMTHDTINFAGIGDWVFAAAAFKASAVTVNTAADDFDAQSQRFSQTTRMESQHQQELQDTFGILPQRPPFAFEDDGQNMRWSDWRALQYEEVDVRRTLPPIPPVSIQEEHTEQLNVTWSARQYDDTETQRALPPTPPVSIEDDAERQKNVDWFARQHDDTDTQRALPPTPPFAIVDEISERPLPGVVPFVEEDQPGKPIVAAAAPNIGLDDIEAHIKSFDRVASYYEDDVFSTTLAPPLAQQDEISERTFNWAAPAIEDDYSTLPPIPAFVQQDEISERWAGTFSVQAEEDQPLVPIVTALPPPSIEDDMGQRWSATAIPMVKDDWYASAPLPPSAYEDDLKTFSSDTRNFSIEEDFVGKPPLPPIIFTTSDDEAAQIHVDWSLGYARFGAATDDYDSHLLPPVQPGPFVGWRTGLKTYPQFAGLCRVYPQLFASKVSIRPSLDARVARIICLD